MKLSSNLHEVLIDALGIGWKGKGRCAWRNWTDHNVINPNTSGDHAALVALGFLVPDPAKNYGRMRVYRVTEAGAKAITGKALPKKLAALIPAPETAEPLPLAA